eukprot:5337741-Pleurochrysis_carterae.AAC.2
MADEKEGRSARREAGSSPAFVGWMRSAHRARSPACPDASEEEVDGLAGGVAELAGAQSRSRREGQEVWGNGVWLLHEDAVRARAPTAQHESQPPEGAPVAHFLPEGESVAAGLVGARRPHESTMPALDVEEVGDIPDVVHSVVEGLADVHGEGQFAMAAEELAAHGPTELAGQERRRRGVAAREQAADIVKRAEGEK